MKSKQIMFFSVLDDIEQILKNIEESQDIHYFKTGLLDSQQIPHYNSIFDVANLGYTLFGDWNRIDSYLVLPKKISVNVKTVPQRSGEKKFSVDQMLNPKSIELKVGGIYTNIERVIIAGRAATISEDNVSIELFKLFSSKIKKEFKRIGTFYVGKTAEEKLRLGWRLVTNEKSPNEYDLAFN